jgi:hypothetical protein
VCDAIQDGKCKYINPHTCTGTDATMIGVKKIAPYAVRFWGRRVPAADVNNWRQRIPTAAELADFQPAGNVLTSIQNNFCTVSMSPGLLDYRVDGDASCNLTVPTDGATLQTYRYNQCINNNQNALTTKPFLQVGRAWGEIPDFLKSDSATTSRARQWGICVAGFVGLAAATLIAPEGWLATASVYTATGSGLVGLALSCADLFESTDTTFTLKAPIVSNANKQNFVPLTSGGNLINNGDTLVGFQPDVPSVRFRNGSVTSQGSMICVRDLPPRWEYQKEITYESGTINIGLFALGNWGVDATGNGNNTWQQGGQANGARSDWYTYVYDDSKWHIRLLEPCGVDSASITALKQLYDGGGRDAALDTACTFAGTNFVRNYIAELYAQRSDFGYFTDAKAVITKWCQQYGQITNNNRPYGSVTDMMARQGTKGRVKMTTTDNATKCNN